MGIFTTTKQDEPKKQTISANGVAFRLHGKPEEKDPKFIERKPGIWTISK